MEESLNSKLNNRKIRKPLMERKRRARINKSLNELQQLLTETDYPTKGSKLEKADILEMTVEYLKNVTRNDCSKEMKENIENSMMERYILGYEKCLEEMRRIVSEIPGLDSDLQNRINSHLAKAKNRPVVSSGRKTTVDEENSEGQRSWPPGKTCSVLLRGSEEFRILPSKLPNGDVVLLVSSNVGNGDEGLRKTHMWRPWW